jgi:hypothetical protein
VKQPKVLPLVYGGDNKVRSVKQDVPDGRISARISFLLPTTNAQKVMKKACSHSPFGSRMRLLVHENDINRFLVILRMNDLAYCDRLPPVKNEVASLQIAVKQYGISFNIQVTHGYQIAKYKHLIDMFNMFFGPYHECSIAGYTDEAHGLSVMTRSSCQGVSWTAS